MMRYVRYDRRYPDRPLYVHDRDRDLVWCSSPRSDKRTSITFSGAIAARCPYLAVTERMPSYAAVRATVNTILCFTCQHVIRNMKLGRLDGNEPLAGVAFKRVDPML